MLEANRALAAGQHTIARVAGTCERCGGKARLRRYCAKCAAALADLRDQYEAAVGGLTARAKGPSPREWSDLERWRMEVSLDESEARKIAGPYIGSMLSRYVDEAIQGVVRNNEVETFRRACQLLKPDTSLAHALDVKLYRAFRLDRVREGEMPRASSVGLHLPTDEICYLNVPAMRWRYLQAGARSTSGQLVVTNRKVRFSSYERGGELPLGKIMSALDLNPNILTLETTSSSLSGDYTVGDAEWGQVQGG
ncbi:HNH endonuclease, partial [Mycobacterium sp. PO1]